MSISGGLDRALINGKAAGCQVIQIFTRNTSRWLTRPIPSVEIDAFNKARDETGIEPVAAHDTYLINLASPRPQVREKSYCALMEEMERAERLEIPYLVIHPGSHVGDGEKKGFERISDALNRIHDSTPQFRVKTLLETTAGQGTNLGCRFEHLAEIIDRTDARERLGVCLDTCHVFAAGYDFRTPVAYMDLIRKFDSVIGLNRLYLFHINDAKNGVGSGIDRHEHLGQGCIGRRGFSHFLKDPIFEHIPFLIETPKGKNEKGIDLDVVNLSFLKGLMEDKVQHDCI